MAKKTIKIKFQNGITYRSAMSEILNIVADRFDFVESNEPDHVLFGPYGNDVPMQGNYVRIGYFCENIMPQLDICEWAFGVPSEAKINDPKYKRIQWHGLDPDDLVKNEIDAGAILASRPKFCNFLYSHKVPYREEFFKQLSKYKKVDAPGKSMNNMLPIDNSQGGKWGAKRNFLSQYKFTIAFENYVYPGYQTEKLYDAMLCQSIPIYCGDPNIGYIFNTQSFINAPGYININYSPTVQFLENSAQQNFTDIRPMYFKSPKDRIQRKLKAVGRELKMKFQFDKLDFSKLIDRIIELDSEPEKYMAMVGEPWFNNNTPPANAALRDRWIEIFSGGEV